MRVTSQLFQNILNSFMHCLFGLGEVFGEKIGDENSRDTVAVIQPPSFIKKGTNVCRHAVPFRLGYTINILTSVDLANLDNKGKRVLNICLVLDVFAPWAGKYHD
jgi:hypothetical protein